MDLEDHITGYKCEDGIRICGAVVEELGDGCESLLGASGLGFSQLC